MFNGGHTGMGAGGWVLMAVLLVALVALTVWVVARLLPTRSDGHRDTAEAPAEGPREILDRRLAGGEIDVQSYEALRAKLAPRPLERRG